ncbi:hypothetical protein [Dyadobacter sp. CY312]|uniref:hypothetical protein n=1 Tax=Dyadobacter sp. CY312 TaxID=2907303 RepID=UPI001F303F4F|nr:hypothetical protein [Dyadobacter sp. CY312]MCE7041037.1 hypothetical protein [Dyadobacter sp. CY312]
MSKRQSGQFDRIFKENIEAIIPTFITKLLHIYPIHSEELPDQIQHTKERRPDVLKKITDRDQRTFILHLEIQLSDEPDMVFRMAEYHLMIYRKYRIPVEQFVIYIGPKKPKMPVRFVADRHNFEFRLIILSEIDYYVFLNSADPGEIIFAILGDFKNEKPENAVVNIINRIHETTKSDFALKRYMVQLRVLSQIRKLEPITKKAMESISKFFKVEKDFLYIKGMEEGESKRNIAIIQSLIQGTEFDDNKIAELVGVSKDVVREIRTSAKK